MNFEILILAVVIFLVANTYYDGKLLDALKSWSKYYQMGLFIVGGIGLYLLIKNNPQNGKELFSNASEVVKCLPIDKNSKDIDSKINSLPFIEDNHNNKKTTTNTKLNPLNIIFIFNY